MCVTLYFLYLSFLLPLCCLYMCFVEVSVCKKVDFWILSTAQSQILTLWDCRSPSHSVDIWVRNETRKSTFIQIGPSINQFLCVLACGFPHYLLVSWSSCVLCIPRFFSRTFWFRCFMYYSFFLDSPCCLFAPSFCVTYLIF